MNATNIFSVKDSHTPSSWGYGLARFGVAPLLHCSTHAGGSQNVHGAIFFTSSRSNGDCWVVVVIFLVSLSFSPSNNDSKRDLHLPKKVDATCAKKNCG